MSCGAFGGSGNCGGAGSGGAGMGGAGMGGAGMGGAGMGGGVGMGAGMGNSICPGTAPPQPRRSCADRYFFDPFCMPIEQPKNEPTCYFNPFVHAQCLGVDMNMEGFRNDILKCQEDYKKAVWAVLKKYAVGDGKDKDGKDKDKNDNNASNNNRANNSAYYPRRSSSNGFPFDDQRLQRSLKNLPNGHLMQI